MKKLKTIVEQLENSSVRLAALQRQRDELLREISRTKEEHDLGVERMIVDIVRRDGIANLPIGEIVATLHRLASSTAESLNDIQSEKMIGPRSDVVADVRRDAGPQSGIETFVRISCNASADNRQRLQDAGLAWNGRKGGFVGWTDAATIARLRETFGARVLKPVQVMSSCDPRQVTDDDVVGLVAEVQDEPCGSGDSESPSDESIDCGGWPSTDPGVDPDAKTSATAAMSALHAPSPSRGFPARRPVPSA